MYEPNGYWVEVEFQGRSFRTFVECVPGEPWEDIYDYVLDNVNVYVEHDEIEVEVDL